MLQEELADAKNSLSVMESQLQVLMDENQEMKEKVYKYEREERNWSDLLGAIDDVEQSGQTYLAKIKAIKSQSLKS